LLYKLLIIVRGLTILSSKRKNQLLFVFMVAFIFDVGTHELNKVSAQMATTSLAVLNTPPAFTLNPYEVIGSATTTPTNSGDVLQWSAIGDDPNG